MTRVAWLALHLAAASVTHAQDVRISADRRAIDFGIVQMGETSSLISFDIVNRGTETLTLTCAGGALGAPFTTSTDCIGAVLDAEESCSYEYGFDPTTPGLFDSAVALTCNGVPVTVDVLAQAEAPVIGLQVRSVNFGQVTVGENFNYGVTLVNFGRAPATVSCDNDSIAHPAFSIQSTSCNGPPVPPNGECSYRIVFSPTSPGPAIGEFAPTCLGTTLSVQLAGEGVSGPPSQSLYARTRDLNFGPVRVNQPAPFTLGTRVTNEGPTQTVFCTGGGVDPPFANTNDCNGVTLGTLTFCFLEYNVFSTVTGDFSDFSTYTCNGEVYEITLETRIVPPDLVFDAPVIDFQNVPTSRALVSAQSRLVNQGPRSITLNCTGGSETPPFSSAEFCQGQTLFQGDSCAFTFLFFPSSLGSFADSSIRNCNGAELEVALSATAVTPPPLFADGFETPN